jgi:hypothetical protein
MFPLGRLICGTDIACLLSEKATEGKIKEEYLKIIRKKSGAARKAYAAA